MKRFRDTILLPALTVLMTLATLAACSDDYENGPAPQPSVRQATISFDALVPGLELPSATRTAADPTVDEHITQLDLYLFDKNGAFTGIETATLTTEPGYDATNGEYTTTTGTYSATITANTGWIHFLGNFTFADDVDEGETPACELTRNQFLQQYLGRKDIDVMAPLSTSQRVYWGRAKYENNAISPDPVVLYRNYAKVHYTVATQLQEGVTSIQVLGWTLCQEPAVGTVTPFDATRIEAGEDDLSTSPFEFDLTTALPSMPGSRDFLTRNGTEADFSANETSTPTAHYLFEYDDEEEYNANSVYAIFKIKATVKNEQGGEEISEKYYKIALLKDEEMTEDGVVYRRSVYDIKRNHRYLITFSGIEPKLGYDSFEKAQQHNPANNSSIDIEESIPEVVSAKYILRVVNGTVRYYKDVNTATDTDKKAINDILVYFGHTDGTPLSTEEAGQLEVNWETGSEDGTIRLEAEELKIEAASTAADSAGYFRISFLTTPFSEGDNGEYHYKMGLIRVRETAQYLLSRFVRVYIGDPITFRPLLISSDIPAQTGERLTILLDIPDEKYLPADLYPIELRFGSNRVDVEKNLYVDAMKVTFDNSRYDNVLEYALPQDGSSTVYDWLPQKSIANLWGYKYVYTIESTEKAGRQRITLRTVTTTDSNFSVLLEGMSTVTGTAIFNKRELEFKVQKDAEGNNSFQRIMLDDGMPETRLVTTYANVVKPTDGSKGSVTINYTLGTFNETTGQPNTADAAPTEDVQMWIYYDSSVLTPIAATGGTIGTKNLQDVEGNTYFTYTHTKESKRGSITLEQAGTDKAVQNSMVFFTARCNTARTEQEDGSFTGAYGTYSGAAKGDAAYIYTGLNAPALSYRSAGAIINIVDTWQFNPALSATGAAGSYAHNSTAEINCGKDSLLHVRIDRPVFTDDGKGYVALEFESDGMLELQANADYFVEAPVTETRTLADGTQKTYTIVRLQNDPADKEYAYLTFKTTAFHSACTLTMNSYSGTNTTYTSRVPYAPATLTVTNAPITFQGFEFAREEDLVRAYDANNAAPAPVFSLKQDTVKAVTGAKQAIRAYLPASLKDLGTQELHIRLVSGNFRVVSADSDAAQPWLNHYLSQKRYSVESDGSITVVGNDLVQQTDANSNVTACYVDLYIESTKPASGESMKLQGVNSGDDIRIYPYTFSLRHTDTYYYEVTDGTTSYKGFEMEMRQSKENHGNDLSAWPTTDIQNSITEADIDLYYLLNTPCLGPEGRPFKVLLQSGGLLTVDSEATLPTGVSYTADATTGDLTFTVTSTYGTAYGHTGVVLPLTSTKGLAVGETQTVTLTPDSATVELAPASFRLQGSAQTYDFSSLQIKGTGDYTTVTEGMLFTEIPTSSNSEVLLKVTVPAAAAKEETTLNINSTGFTATTVTLPATEDSDGDGLVTHEVTLTTKANGTAEVISISGVASSYELNPITFAIATVVEGVDYHEAYFTGKKSKDGIGHQIFDVNGSDALDNAGDETFKTTYPDYAYSAKMDDYGRITFYAPEDDMYLTLIGAARNGNEPTGYLIITTTSDESYTYTTDAFGHDGKKFVLKLSKAGIYTIVRGGGKQFGLHYLKLTKDNPARKSADFADQNNDGTAKDLYWTTDADGGANFFGCTTESDWNKSFYVPENTEYITLRLKMQPNAEGVYEKTTLYLTGYSKNYAFTVGTTTEETDESGNAYYLCTYEATPNSEGIIDVSVKPQNYWNYHQGINEVYDEEGKHLMWLGGSFTISATSDSYQYTDMTVDVKPRPRLLVELCDANKQPFTGNAYNYKKGDNVYLRLTVPARYTGNTLTCRIASRNGTGSYIGTTGTVEYGDGTDQQNDSFTISSADGTIGGTATLTTTASTSPKVFYYKWTANAVAASSLNLDIRTEATSQDGYDLLQLKREGHESNSSYSWKPIVIEEADYSFGNHIQYRTAGGEWQYIYGNNHSSTTTDILDASLDYYANNTHQPAFASGATVEMRVQLADALTADMVSTTNGMTASSTTDSGYATFSFTPTADGDFRFQYTNPSTNTVVQSAQVYYTVNDYDFSTLQYSLGGSEWFSLSEAFSSTDNATATLNIASGATLNLRVKTASAGTTVTLSNGTTATSADDGNGTSYATFTLSSLTAASTSLQFTAPDYNPSGTLTVTTETGNTYEYYIETNDKTAIHEYQNGTATDTDVLTLYGHYTYRHEHTITVDAVGKSGLTLNYAEHMGHGNQYLTITLPYPMQLQYIWAPRKDGKYLTVENEAGEDIGIRFDTTPVTTQTYGADYNYNLPAGKYTIITDGHSDETQLYYLRLTPLK
ncbi:MAG: hypothetical protein IJ511_05560 [Bacteroides sp.]|nr:hypothetical protein [Bacteroides sp.]